MLERPFASGGMGSLWIARHHELNAKVAVKFISAAYAGSSVLRARFEREARAAAQVVSGNVVRVHDYGVQDDTPYIVMELLEGEDLGARLKREIKLPLEVVSALCTQIARGLRRAHKAGFVHRDLKPSNIFLAKNGDDAEDDEEEVVKILDFGVAKETTGTALDETTKTGEIMGSPHYMSPEQILESKDIDARSDLWALGVILFRAITGALPFPGDAAGLVMSKILTDRIPMPSEYVADLPAAIDDFFRRAFQRDPRDRFQSAREMAEAFAEAVTGTRAARLSWTFLGSALASRPTVENATRVSSTQMSASPPSSTLLAPILAPKGLEDSHEDARATAAALDDTADVMLQAAPSSHTVREFGLARGPESSDIGSLQGSSLHHTGTLTVAYRAVEEEPPPRARRTALAWTLGGAGMLGVALGWGIIGLFMNSSGVAAAEARPASASIAQIATAAVSPLAPAFSVSIPAPADPRPEAMNDGSSDKSSTLGAAPQPGAPLDRAQPASTADPTARSIPVAAPSQAPFGRWKQAKRMPRLGF